MDISLGLNGFAQYLLLAEWISSFLIGFIAGGYLLFLIFKKTRILSGGELVFSIIGGIIIGVIGFGPIINIVASRLTNYQSFTTYFLWYSLPIIVILELIVVRIHFIYFRKQKGKKNNKWNISDVTPLMSVKILN